MTKNVDALMELKEVLLAHPDQHHQEHFSSNHLSNPLTDCGTTACAAGWTLALMGMTLKEAYGVWGTSASALAAEKLGLSWAEREALFFNTLEYEDPEQAALDLIDKYIDMGKNGL